MVSDELAGQVTVVADVGGARLYFTAAADTDPENVRARLAALVAGIPQALDADAVWSFQPPSVEVWANPILSEAEYAAKKAAEDAQWAAAHPWLEAEYEAALDAHSDNGKLGWWRVSNYKGDSVLVREVSTVREALARALASGVIGMPDWQETEFVGETLPEVVAL
jgi:hypothetical protein